jgi:hypothetical protein
MGWTVAVAGLFNRAKKKTFNFQHRTFNAQQPESWALKVEG